MVTAPPPVTATSDWLGVGGPVEGEEEGAAAKIQSIQRGKLARRELQEQQQAATKMQAVQRGKAARKTSQRVMGEDDSAVGDFGIAGSEDETAAAEKIQSLQRGKQTRRELQEQQGAATKMQAVQRGKAARKQAVSDLAPIVDEGGVAEEDEEAEEETVDPLETARPEKVDRFHLSADS